MRAYIQSSLEWDNDDCSWCDANRERISIPSPTLLSNRPISHIKIKFDLIEKRFTLVSHFTNSQVRRKNVKLDFSVCKLFGTGSFQQQQQLLNRFHCLSYLIPENLFNFSSPLSSFGNGKILLALCWKISKTTFSSFDFLQCSLD